MAEVATAGPERGGAGEAASALPALTRAEPSGEAAASQPPLPDVVPGSQAESMASRTFELRALLRASVERVIEVFRCWDDDDSGAIDRREFRRALRALVPDVTGAECDLLFETFDADGSGSIDFRELNRQLRRGAEEDLCDRVVIDKLGNVLHVNLGGSTALEMASSNRFALRKGERAHKRHTALPASQKLVAGPLSVKQQLRAILGANAVRVIDLFRDWDDDSSGTIDKKEFRRAVATLGYDAPRAEVEALFADLDADGSGEIDYSELNAALRAGADVVLDEALRAGAAGEIVLRAKNRTSAVDRLQTARAAASDPDPLAALRRAAVGGMTVSPRSFQKAQQIFAADLCANQKSVRPPTTNVWADIATRRPPWAAPSPRAAKDGEGGGGSLRATAQSSTPRGGLWLGAEARKLRDDAAEQRLEAGAGRLLAGARATLQERMEAANALLRGHGGGSPLRSPHDTGAHRG
eukprot:gene1441-8518_t